METVREVVVRAELWIGIAITILASAFGWSVTFGKISNRLDIAEKDIDNIKRIFVDSDGNQRLLTVGDHTKICLDKQAINKKTLDNILIKVEAYSATSNGVLEVVEAVHMNVNDLHKSIDKLNEKLNENSRTKSTNG